HHPAQERPASRAAVPCAGRDRVAGPRRDQLRRTGVVSAALVVETLRGLARDRPRLLLLVWVLEEPAAHRTGADPSGRTQRRARLQSRVAVALARCEGGRQELSASARATAHRCAWLETAPRGWVVPAG